MGAICSVQIEYVSAIMCAFSDAILGTLEPNAAGMVLPALYVASPITCHTVGAST